MDYNKRYYVVGVHTAPWGRAICHSFYALYSGALNGLSRKTISGGLPHEEANYRCIKDY